MTAASGGERRLIDPTPAAVRAAIRAVAGDAPGTRDLELAATEVVANAHEHGEGPVAVVVRTPGGRPEVSVHERGPGPAVTDPVAPPPDAERGRGRWLASQLALVQAHRTASGYVVELTARGVPGPGGTHASRG